MGNGKLALMVHRFGHSMVSMPFYLLCLEWQLSQHAILIGTIITGITMDITEHIMDHLVMGAICMVPIVTMLKAIQTLSGIKSQRILNRRCVAR